MCKHRLAHDKWQAEDSVNLLGNIRRALLNLVSFNMDPEDAVVLFGAALPPAVMAEGQAQIERLLEGVRTTAGPEVAAEFRAMVQTETETMRANARLLRADARTSPTMTRYRRLERELRRLTQAAAQARPQSAEHITLLRRAHRLRVRLARGVA
jgi:hypothetical protein